MNGKLILSWDDISQMTQELANKLRPQKDRWINLYGIPRGGLVVAVLLAHQLNIPIIDDPNDFEWEKTLIVDDICETGKTIDPNSEGTLYEDSHVAVLIDKLRSQRKTRNPDFWACSCDNDLWVVFPWETSESTYTSNYPNH